MRYHAVCIDGEWYVAYPVPGFTPTVWNAVVDCPSRASAMEEAERMNRQEGQDHKAVKTDYRERTRRPWGQRGLF